jgi:hypothetical protein
MTGADLFTDRLVEVWAEPGNTGTGAAIGARGIVTALPSTFAYALLSDIV